MTDGRDPSTGRQPEAPASAGFSTGFWKEFRLRHGRPGAYVAVVAAYALYALVLLATADSPRDVWQRWLALGVLTASANVAAAIHGASRAPGRKKRDTLRDLVREASPARRERLLQGWFRDEAHRALVAPAVALALLAPLYLAPGLVGPELNPSWLTIGALMWVQAAASTAVAVAAGAWAAQTGSLERPGVLRIAARALLAVGARLPLSAVFGLLLTVGYWGGLDDRVPGAIVAGAFLAGDVLPCLLAWLLLVRGGAGRLGEALHWREKNPELKDLAREEPESLGLDVSFWALWRWKLFRDPLFRAERRGFWTWRRLAVLWGGFLVAACLPIPVQIYGWRMANWGLPEIAFDLAVTSLYVLPFLAIATIVAATLATDRQSGVSESLAITPVAPLRLAASRLAGKCAHPALVLCALIVPTRVFWWWYGAHVGGAGSSESGASMLVHGCSGALALLNRTMIVAMYGAVGLYCAARWRSVVWALISSYGFLVGLTFATSFLIRWYWFLSVRHWSEHSFAIISGMLIDVLYLLLYAILFRFFLMAAARRLAVLSDD